MDVDGEDDYRREKDKDRRRDRGDRGDRDDREKEGRNGRDYGSRDKDRSRRRDSGLDYERGEGGRDRERDRDSYRERDKERDGDGGKDGERSSGRKDRRYSVEGEERDYKVGLVVLLALFFPSSFSKVVAFSHIPLNTTCMTSSGTRSRSEVKEGVPFILLRESSWRFDLCKAELKGGGVRWVTADGRTSSRAGH